MFEAFQIPKYPRIRKYSTPEIIAHINYSGIEKQTQLKKLNVMSTLKDVSRSEAVAYAALMQLHIFEMAQDTDVFTTLCPDKSGPLVVFAITLSNIDQ